LHLTETISKSDFDRESISANLTDTSAEQDLDKTEISDEQGEDVKNKVSDNRIKKILITNAEAKKRANEMALKLMNDNQYDIQNDIQDLVETHCWAPPINLTQRYSELTEMMVQIKKKNCVIYNSLKLVVGCLSEPLYQVADTSENVSKIDIVIMVAEEFLSATSKHLFFDATDSFETINCPKIIKYERFLYF
jgi:hypothetical protein